MNRLTRLLTIALAPALAAATLGACGYVRPPALTIARDGSSDPFFTFSADELFEELGKGDSMAPTTTARSGVVAAGEVAVLLTGKVRPQILTQILDDRGVTVTEADRQLAEAAMGQQQSAPTEQEQEFQAQFAALARVLAEDFFARPGNEVDDYARRFYEQRQASFAQPAQTCLHVITVDAGDGQSQPSEEQYNQALPQAQALRQRLNNEPFERVFEASGQSTEGIPGGDLGCRPDRNLPEELVQGMADVSVGAISQPLRWRAGWAIVRVDDRRPARTPAFEEVRDQAVAATHQTFGQQFVNEVLDRANRTFVVTVDPRFGRWSAEQGQVLPPDGAATPTTPTTSTTLPPLDEGLTPEPGGTPGTGAPEGTAPEGPEGTAPGTAPEEGAGAADGTAPPATGSG